MRRSPAVLSGTPRQTGPYGESWHDGRRWRYRLSDAGKRKVVDYLELWPRPVSLLRRYHEGLYKALVTVGSTSDEIDAICLDAVVLAHIRWRPDARPGGVKISTVLVWALLSEAQAELRRRKRNRDVPSSQLFGRTPGNAVQQLEPAAPVETDGCIYDRDTREDVARHVTTLPLRQQRIFAMLATGMSYTQAGDILGCSKERIRQLRDDALAVLQIRLNCVTNDDQALDRRIIDFIQREPVTAQEITNHIALPYKTVRTRLRNLFEGGVINSHEQVGCRTYYSMNFERKDPNGVRHQHDRRDGACASRVDSCQSP